MLFFQSLGMARTAEVKRDALIGRATAQMETLIRQSLASEQLTKSKLDNDTQVNIWNQHLELFFLNNKTVTRLVRICIVFNFKTIKSLLLDIMKHIAFQNLKILLLCFRLRMPSVISTLRSLSTTRK